MKRKKKNKNVCLSRLKSESDAPSVNAAPLPAQQNRKWVTQFGSCAVRCRLQPEFRSWNIWRGEGHLQKVDENINMGHRCCMFVGQTHYQESSLSHITSRVKGQKGEGCDLWFTECGNRRQKFWEWNQNNTIDEGGGGGYLGKRLFHWGNSKDWTAGGMTAPNDYNISWLKKRWFDRVSVSVPRRPSPCRSVWGCWRRTFPQTDGPYRLHSSPLTAWTWSFSGRTYLTSWSLRWVEEPGLWFCPWITEF